MAFFKGKTGDFVPAKSQIVLLHNNEVDKLIEEEKQILQYFTYGQKGQLAKKKKYVIQSAKFPSEIKPLSAKTPFCWINHVTLRTKNGWQLSSFHEIFIHNGQTVKCFLEKNYTGCFSAKWNWEKRGGGEGTSVSTFRVLVITRVSSNFKRYPSTTRVISSN